MPKGKKWIDPKYCVRYELVDVPIGELSSADGAPKKALKLVRDQRPKSWKKKSSLNVGALLGPDEVAEATLSLEESLARTFLEDRTCIGEDDYDYEQHLIEGGKDPNAIFLSRDGVVSRVGDLMKGVIGSESNTVSVDLGRLSEVSASGVNFLNNESCGEEIDREVLDLLESDEENGEVEEEVTMLDENLSVSIQKVHAGLDDDFVQQANRSTKTDFDDECPDLTTSFKSFHTPQNESSLDDLDDIDDPTWNPDLAEHNRLQAMTEFQRLTHQKGYSTASSATLVHSNRTPSSTCLRAATAPDAAPTSSLPIEKKIAQNRFLSTLADYENSQSSEEILGLQDISVYERELDDFLSQATLLGLKPETQQKGPRSRRIDNSRPAPPPDDRHMRQTHQEGGTSVLAKESANDEENNNITSDNCLSGDAAMDSSSGTMTDDSNHTTAPDDDGQGDDAYLTNSCCYERSSDSDSLSDDLRVDHGPPPHCDPANTDNPPDVEYVEWTDLGENSSLAPRLVDVTQYLSHRFSLSRQGIPKYVLEHGRKKKRQQRKIQLKQIMESVLEFDSSSKGTNMGVARPKGEDPNDRKLRKKNCKSERRKRREEKKVLKQSYKSEEMKQKKLSQHPQVGVTVLTL
ncbi:uncharacterized protein LOC126325947 [Schistocerca gregaria]|uniref:uncharacterized protein LOC126325947 n=1 Tax=Schistocerca gregaria TaxID=7010 RepID=UPI00211F1CAC|nr:uncharacterized protein LOC126325947 [Schistocerca gregaria]